MLFTQLKENPKEITVKIMVLHYADTNAQISKEFKHEQFCITSKKRTQKVKCTGEKIK